MAHELPWTADEQDATKAARSSHMPAFPESTASTKGKQARPLQSSPLAEPTSRTEGKFCPFCCIYCRDGSRSTTYERGSISRKASTAL